MLRRSLSILAGCLLLVSTTGLAEAAHLHTAGHAHSPAGCTLCDFFLHGIPAIVGAAEAPLVVHAYLGTLTSVTTDDPCLDRTVPAIVPRGPPPPPV